MIDFEVIIPASAIEVRVITNAGRGVVIAIDNVNHRLLIFNSDGVEYTPDQEVVISSIAINLHGSHAVIGNECVISIASADFNNFCREIVVDALVSCRFV